MHSTDDRLEVVNIERPRIEVAIPTNDIKWMMGHRDLSPARTVFHQDFCVLFLVDGQYFRWPMQVSLGIRRSHLNLALFV